MGSPASPRLRQLENDLGAGHSAALEDFWQEVAQQGAPLIEPIAGESTNRLVTFLWRGGDDLRNVVVVDGIAGADFIANQLTRLAGTDVWYRSYRARDDVRTVYTFSLNDPLLSEDDPAWAEHDSAVFAPDPLNPRRFLEEGSLLELPNATPEPWVSANPNVPAGQVTHHRVRSELLHNERDVWLYTPPGHDPFSGPYPWLLLNDGGGYVALPTPTMLDNLIAAGRIPPVAAIFVGIVPGERARELGCGENFLAFLTDELLPWTRARCPLSRDPRQAVIGGVSLGGVMAAFAALRRPDVFGNVLSQSGAFWWLPGFDDNKLAPEDEEQNWLIRQYVRSPRLPVRFHLSVGLLEGDLRPRRIRAGMLPVNAHMHDVLEAKGYDVTYVEFPGGHDFAGWRGVLPAAMECLLAA